MHIPRILALICCLALPASVVHAWSYGVANTTQRPGSSGNGCASCHGASPSVLDVMLEGEPDLLPGSSTHYSMIIDNIGNATARGGFGAAITKMPGNQPLFTNVAGEPTATVDSGTQIVQNNATFPLRVPSQGRVTYLIGLTIPANITLGSEYIIYSVADAGHGTNQVGWNFAPSFTITIRPPVPDSLAADQENASIGAIALTWNGSNQGEHFRVLRKTGGFPASPLDAAAELIYEGPDTDTTATGLAPGTRYFFAVYGKVPDQAYYSSAAAQTVAASLPENPGALTVTPISGSEIALSWSGTSAEYRLLRKLGEPPLSPSDAAASLIFEGSGNLAVDVGLSSELVYYYRLWSKVPEMDVFSVASSDAIWGDSIFSDGFETPL